MNRKKIVLVLLGLLLVWGLWKVVVVFGRSEEEVVRAAQGELLRAVERRDWHAVGEFLTLDYTDEGGHNRETAVEDGRQALATFYTLTIKEKVSEVRLEDGKATVAATIRLEGTGAGVSQFVLSTVNGMTGPWFFFWRKEGRWPWDWKVERIHQERLASLPRSF